MFWIALAYGAFGPEDVTLADGDASIAPLPSDRTDAWVAQERILVAGTTEYRVGRFDLQCRTDPTQPWKSFGAGLQDTGLALVHDGVLWTLRPLEPGGSTQPLVVGRMRSCDDPAWEDSFAADALVVLELPVGTDVQQLWAELERWDTVAFERQDELCFGGRPGWWCFDAEAVFAEGFDQVPLEVRPDAVAAALPDAQPYLDAVAAGSGLDPSTNPYAWSFAAQVVLPDGTLGVLLRADWLAAGFEGVSVAWAIHYDPTTDGGLDLIGPSLASPGSGIQQLPAPLGVADSMFYDPVWNALWVGRVVEQLPSSRILSFHTVGSINDAFQEGFVNGLSYRVLSLDEPGRSGLMDLTNALHRDAVCEESVPCLPHVGLDPTWFDDTLVLRRLNALDYYSDDVQLVFDRDAVDLDGDTLTRAEEAALGTSDFDPDSDVDGASDAWELALGDDPLVHDRSAPDARIETAILTLHDVAHAVGWDEEADYSDAIGPDAPLCRLDRRDFTGECRDLAGRVLATWTQDMRSTPVVAYDNRYVLVFDLHGVDRVDLTTGTRTPLVDAATLHAAIGDVITGGPESGFAAYQIWVPVDQDVWMMTVPDPFDLNPDIYRLYKLDDQGLTLVFDHHQVFCDLGLMGCDAPMSDNFQPSDGRPFRSQGLTMEMMGWNPELQRVMVGAEGYQDSFLFGVDRDGDALRLDRARGLYATERASWADFTDLDWCETFPSRFTPVGDELTLVRGTRSGNQLQRYDSVEVPLVSDIAPCGYEGHRKSVALAVAPGMASGLASNGPANLVRFERREIPAGGSLYLSNGRPGTPGVDDGAQGSMLYGVPARGGLVPLWERRLEPVQHATGFDLDADGMCIADRPGQQLVTLVPEGQIPSTVEHHLTGVDAIGCHRGSDGAWYVLTGQGLFRLDGDALIEVDALDDAVQPVALLPDAAEPLGFRVFDRGAADAPLGWIERRDGTLERFDGPLTIGSTTPFPQEHVLRQSTSWVSGHERSDGTVVLTWSTVNPDPHAYDPTGLDHDYADVYLHTPAGDLLPVGLPNTAGDRYHLLHPASGTFDEDVWDGLKGPVCWIDPTQPACVAPSPATDPSTPSPETPLPIDGPGGCCSTSGGAPAWLLLPLALVALRRRRSQ